MLRRLCFEFLSSASRGQTCQVHVRDVVQLRPTINKLSAMYTKLKSDPLPKDAVKVETDRANEALEINLENLDFSTLDDNAVTQVMNRICDAVKSSSEDSITISHLPEGLFLHQLKARMYRQGYVGGFVRYFHDLGQAHFEKAGPMKHRIVFTNPYRSSLPAPC